VDRRLRGRLCRRAVRRAATDHGRGAAGQAGDQTEEVGYFGSARVTHQVSVFVYSNLGPRAGNHVTVCLGGTCKAAKGHNAHLAWYSASFSTRGLHMGDAVKFTAIARSSAGQSRVSVTKPLLCMHNDGSTPQT
jgi:hypothetical protein